MDPSSTSTGGLSTSTQGPSTITSIRVQVLISISYGIGPLRTVLITDNN